MIAYLIGSLSPALSICRWAGLPDPRTAGSKNPGTTNVLRLGGKKLAFITLICDILKGLIPVGIVMFFTANPIMIGTVILAVFLGHLYPVFYHFKGGKGVATAIGAILMVCWPAGLLTIATWILVALIFRISSLAALTAAVLAPVYVGYFKIEEKGLENGLIFAGFVAAMSAFIIWRHQANIKRLVQGIEPKIRAKP